MPICHRIVNGLSLCLLGAASRDYGFGSTEMIVVFLPLRVPLSTFLLGNKSQERAMVQAVARWQAQEHNPALLQFNAALGRQPEWENSTWVKALHSPLVAQSLKEMQAERERRKHTARSG
jgi:hypothetical protein